MPKFCVKSLKSLRIITVFVAIGLTVTVFMIQTASICQAAELQKIDTFFSGNASQVILQLSESVRYKHQNLPKSDRNPNRCYVDLYSTNPAHMVSTWMDIENAGITRIRTGIHATALRVVLDLKEGNSCTITTADDPFRVMVTVIDRTETKKESRFAQTELDKKLTLPSVKPAETVESSTAEGDNLKTETTTTFSDFSVTEPKQIETWGWIQLFTAHDTKKQKAEDHHFSRLRSRVGADWETDLNSDYSLQARGSLDVDHIFYQQDMADDDTDLNFAETYLRLNSSNWDVTIGKQRVRWGKSDQLSPIDTINPQDFRQFITVDLEERTIPSWMLRTRWYGESTGLETIIQPWFESSEIDFFDSDWAFYRNFRKAITSNSLASEQLKDYTKAIRIKEDKPNASLENMSAAVRFTWQTEQSDFAVSYHYGWEALPTINRFPIKNIDYSGDPSDNVLDGVGPTDFTNERVEAEYKRQQTIGFEWETVIDPIGFRGEIAHKDNVAFISRDLTSERNAVTQLVSGIDYTSESEWYFNLQGSWYYIHDFTDKILYYEENTVSAFGEIRKPILRGNLELATKYNYIFTDGSSYLQPSVKMKYFQNIECEAGAMIFSGDGDSLLGSYDKTDQVYATLKYSF